LIFIFIFLCYFNNRIEKKKREAEKKREDQMRIAKTEIREKKLRKLEKLIEGPNELVISFLLLFSFPFSTFLFQ
jgi:hypothetical protein